MDAHALPRCPRCEAQLQPPPQGAPNAPVASDAACPACGTTLPPVTAASAPAAAPPAPAPPAAGPPPAPATGTQEPGTVFPSDDRTVSEEVWDESHHEPVGHPQADGTQAPADPGPVPEESSVQLAEPRKLGRYVVVRLLGEGTFGKVYLCRHPELGSYVAVKELKTSDRNQVARFRREAEISARLRHPGIATVYDIWEAAGKAYFAMEYVEGPDVAGATAAGPATDRPGDVEIVKAASLDHVLDAPERYEIKPVPVPAPRAPDHTSDEDATRYRTSALPEGLAAQWMLEIAQALQVAHDAGVIHRDLKPANILLDRDRRMKVTDFGVAKVLDPRGTMWGKPAPVGTADADPATPVADRADAVDARSGVIGTPLYMSLEQAEGRVDARSDVYSLGATLYEFLTGRAPFQDGTTENIWVKISRGDIQSPRLVNPGVSLDMAAICLMCLKQDPARRYQSARELAEDLDRFVKNLPVRARPASFVYRLRKRIQRNPLASAGIALAGVALAVAGWLRFAPGWVQVAGLPPEAHISLDGADRGAGRSLFVWPPRRVRVEAAMPGKVSETREVDVQPGKTANVPVTLLSATGTLTVAVEPANAVLHLAREGKPFRDLRGPQQDTALPVGSYAVTVEAEGYLPITTPLSLHVRAEEKSANTMLPPIRLVHEYGFVTVRANVDGAKVLVYPTSAQEFDAAAHVGVARKQSPPVVGQATMRTFGPRGAVAVPLPPDASPPARPLRSTPRPIWEHEIPPKDQPPLHSLSLPIENYRLDTGCYRLIYVKPGHMPREQFVRIELTAPSDEGKAEDRKTGLLQRPGHTVCSAFLGAREVWSATAGDGLGGGATLGDLDGDGIIDCVTCSGSGRICAFSGKDGRTIWATDAGGTMEGRLPPALADLDRDGIPDCIFGSDAGLLAALSGRDGRPLWTCKTGGPVQSPPATADLDGDGVPDCVLGSDDHSVYAVSGRDGHLLWRFETGKEVAWQPALADLDGDGIPDCVVGSLDGQVYALSGRDGHLLWSFKTGAAVRSRPALADLDGDGVPDCVVGSGDGKVYALSGRDGKPLWSFRTLGEIRSSAALADLNGDGVPDCVIGSADSRVYALSGRTGGVLWQFRTGDAVYGSPALADIDGDGVPDCVVGSWDGSVYALSGRDGKLLWRHEVGSPMRSLAVVADLEGDGILECVVTDDGGKVRVLSATDGAPIWRFKPETSGSVPYSPAAGLADVDGDGVLDCLGAAVGAKVYALSGRDGEPIWSFQAQGDLHAAPAVADLNGDGTADCIIGSTSKAVYALSGRDGTALWTFKTGGEIHTTPAVSDLDGDGTPDCVIGSNDGGVYAISGRTGHLIWRFVRRAAVASSPALADLDGDGVPDCLVGSDDQGVYALAGKDGRVLWRFQTQGAVRSAPALGDLDGDGCPDVVVGSDDGNLYALSGKSGKELWRVPIGGPARTSPLVADLDGDGALECLMVTADNRLLALAGRDGAVRWEESALVGVEPTQQPVWPALADLDGDGSPDCVLLRVFWIFDTRIGPSRNTVSVRSGKDGRELWDRAIATTTVNSPTIGDLDGDGVPECLVACSDYGLSALSLRLPRKDGAAASRGEGPRRSAALQRARRAAMDWAWRAVELECEASGLTAASAPAPAGAPAARAAAEGVEAACLRAVWGRARLHLGERPGALAELQAAARRLPRSAAVQFDLALTLAAERPGDAAAALARAYVFDPADTLAWLATPGRLPPGVGPQALRPLLAAAAELLADPARAASLFPGAGRDAAGTAVGRAFAWLQGRRAGGGTSRPDADSLRLARAAALFALERPEEALPLLDALVARDPFGIAPRRFRWLARLANGDQAGAAKDGRMVQRLGGGIQDRAFYRFQPLGDQAAALAERRALERRKAQNPGWGDYQAAQKALAAGDVQAALDGYAAALKAEPENVEYHVGYAELGYRLAEGIARGVIHASDPPAGQPRSEPALAVQFAEIAVEHERPLAARARAGAAPPLPLWARQKGYTHTQVLTLYLDALASAYFARDPKAGAARAVAALEDALRLGPPEELRAAMQARLEQYRAAAAGR